MNNLSALAASFAYIFIVLIIATLVAKFSRGASESSRKLVHILVGNWIFITPFFTDLWAVVLVPASFIIINSLSLKYKLIAAMERDDDSLGTVYYALSLFILTAASFILDWPRLAFFGVLIMAYGDGLAAVIGQRFGRIKPFPFAPKKSLAGTLTVAIVAFIVTALVSLFVRGGAESAPALPLIILVSLLTALFSAAIELVGERGCDNIILPLGSAFFAEMLLRYPSIGLFLYLLLAAVILVIAYKKNAITPTGMVAAFLVALSLYCLGGPYIASSLILFFILGSAVSKIKNQNKRQAEALQESTEARSWHQVLANSLPAVILLWLQYFFPEIRVFSFLAFAVFSAAAADTFSSEIGMLSNGRVFNILNGKPLPKGVSGGVSLVGLLAAVVGSLLLSLLLLPEYGLRGFIYATLLGIAGSLLDSILGASIQRKYKSEVATVQDRANHNTDVPVKGFKLISNNSVNLITLFLISIIGFVLFR